MIVTNWYKALRTMNLICVNLICESYLTSTVFFQITEKLFLVRHTLYQPSTVFFQKTFIFLPPLYLSETVLFKDYFHFCLDPRLPKDSTFLKLTDGTVISNFTKLDYHHFPPDPSISFFLLCYTR